MSGRNAISKDAKPAAIMRDGLEEQYRQSTRRKMLFYLALAMAIALLAGVAAILGEAEICIADVAACILAGLFPGRFHTTAFTDMIVWDLRLHRILMGIVAGAGLGVSGAVMQGILKNPLASPFTLGISSAAGFGAALAIILGAGIAAGTSASWLVIINAFLFALLSALAVYGLARYKGISSETMILAGIAIMYLFSALTSFLQYAGDADHVHEVVFWMMGSLSRSSWERMAMVLIVLVICLPYLIVKSWDLNALGTGDETAQSLGVNVEGTRVIYMMLSSLITASIICFTGTIGFIDLVAPHIARMVIGGDHRFLLPGSALVGSLLLLGADTLSRVVLAPAILPVGIMTSFLGVPFFLYLFLQRRRTF
ncbi:MAG: Cobalamin import system permease protein BtuC [Methanosaeta sp. PtaU1.Bin112]|nr:MAG: Cobalamin import system permease protein BtuC [Methanosaeta sp. PtaU1.Bin112]